MSETDRDFDAYAASYDQALNKGVSLSGERKEYFAAKRVAWLKGCLRKVGADAQTVMDYGCGTGTAFPFMRAQLAPEQLVGIDVSEESLRVARADVGNATVCLSRPSAFRPASDMSVVYSNGTFHHIPLAERAQAVRFIYDSLRPGGLFALWENNPWNPATRLVMKRIPFDRDALPLSVREACRLLRQGGFTIVRTDFLFIFPHWLGFLRGCERFMTRLPLGAQYQVLGLRP